MIQTIIFESGNVPAAFARQQIQQIIKREEENG